MRATALLSGVDGGSLSGFARRWVRGVCELAKLCRQQVGGLLADVDSVVANTLEGPGDHHHAEAVLPHLGIPTKLQDALDNSPVGSVDELVAVDERLGARPGPLAAR